jgi:L-lactate dehydrogenase
LIAQELKAAPSQVNALILGEHGDSMVPIWSSAAIGGLPLDKYPAWNNRLADELFTRTKGSGAEVIKKKTGAGFAVGIAIRDVIHSIVLDQRRVLPVSTVQSGCYDIRDVALSVPTVVGRGGCLARHEIELWPKEVQLLRKSGLVLRQTLQQVLSRIGARR